MPSFNAKARGWFYDAQNDLLVARFGETPVFNFNATRLSLVGDLRWDFSDATVLAGNTDGGLIKMGTSASRIVEDTANMRFININVDNGATSGDNRAMYLREFLTGTGGGGEALRAFTTVEDVRGGTAHGAHISLNFGDTGSLSGLGVAMRATLHIANQAYTSLPGTFAAIQPEIWSDGASSDPVGLTELSLIRCSIGGHANGIADVDDDAFLLVLTGGTIGSGNIVESSVGEVNYSHSARCKLNGTTVFMMFASQVG